MRTLGVFRAFQLTLTGAVLLFIVGIDRLCGYIGQREYFSDLQRNLDERCSNVEANSNALFFLAQLNNNSLQRHTGEESNPHRLIYYILICKKFQWVKYIEFVRGGTDPDVIIQLMIYLWLCAPLAVLAIILLLTSWIRLSSINQFWNLMLTLITLMLCGVMLFFTIVTHWRWENILFSNMEGDHTFELPIQVIFIEVVVFVLILSIVYESFCHEKIFHSEVRFFSACGSFNPDGRNHESRGSHVASSSHTTNPIIRRYSQLKDQRDRSCTKKARVVCINAS